MAVFQPPPTWADPVLVNETTGKFTFNPVWLKWFIDLVGVINASGGGGGSVTHNDTSGLQGGTANQFYHLTSAQNSWVASALAGTLGLHPSTPAGAAQAATTIYGGNGVPVDAQGNNGDFYLRGDGSAGTFIYHRSAGAWAAFA